MRFSHIDKKDQRIVKHSTHPLDMPAKLAEAPDGEGVFIFIEEGDSVAYVGEANSGSINSAVNATAPAAMAAGATHYRWFSTADQASAEALAGDWRAKYAPSRQHSL